MLKLFSCRVIYIADAVFKKFPSEGCKGHLERMNPYYGNPYGGNTYYPQAQMSWGYPSQMGGGGYGMPGVPGVYAGYPQFPHAPSYPTATRSIGGGGGWGSVQVPLAMQAGLYASAISTSAQSVNSSMGMGRGFDAGLYASVPAVNSPKKMPTGSRQGTVGLMLWPKEGSNELAVTGTADGTSAHTSKLEVSSFLCADDSHNYSDLTPTCSRPCADLILAALPWKHMTNFPVAFETSLR
jgi:hypothetical protein